MLIDFTSQTNSQISASTKEGGGASQECQLEDGHTPSESSSELVVLTTFVRSGHGVETVPVPRLSSFCLRGTSSQSHLTHSCAQSVQRLAQSASKFLIFATRSVRTEPMSFSSLPCFDWIRTMPQWTSTTMASGSKKIRSVLSSTPPTTSKRSSYRIERLNLSELENASTQRATRSPL